MSGFSTSVRGIVSGFFLGLPWAAGCGEAGLVTYPIEGRVVIEAGGPESLEGQFVEVALVEDPSKRATGIIGSDGKFKLETLDKGQVWGGARPGKYQARLTLNDEGDGSVKKPRIPRKYLDFKSSGWSLQVPPVDQVRLVVGPK